MRRHLWAIAVGVLGVVILGAYLAFSQVTLDALVHPEREPLGPAPSTLGIAYQDVSFRTSDGLTLRGWWVPGTAHRTVVLLHGYRGTRSEAWDKAGSWLHAAGYNVLAFDFRAEGRSDGDTVTIGWLEPRDAAAAVAYAKSRDPGPLALMGYSMGAGVALLSAPRLPDVAAVVEDSGWTTLDQVVRVSFEQFAHVPAWAFQGTIVTMGELELGYRITDVRPVDSAAHLRQPLLAIIGEDDTLIPPAQGRAIYARAPEPKELLEVPGAGHTEAHQTDPARYERTVLAFLAADLRG